MVVFLLVLWSASANGCGPREPSPFAAIASPGEVAGVYQNASDDAPPNGRTLWQMLHPQIARDAADGVAREDRPDDRVEVLVSGDGRNLASRLLRGGEAIAERTGRCDYARGADRLRRSKSNLSGWGAFPLVWATGHERMELGKDAEFPERLHVAREHNGVVWILIMPVYGAGGGPGEYVFSPATRPSSAADPSGARGFGR
jgi:hypothetical protein